MFAAGLTQRFNSNVECDNCEIQVLKRNNFPLKLAYSLNNKKSRGFLCIDCAIRLQKVNDQDLIDYVTNYGTLWTRTNQ